MENPKSPILASVARKLLMLGLALMKLQNVLGIGRLGTDLDTLAAVACVQELLVVEEAATTEGAVHDESFDARWTRRGQGMESRNDGGASGPQGADV